MVAECIKSKAFFGKSIVTGKIKAFIVRKGYKYRAYVDYEGGKVQLDLPGCYVKMPLDTFVKYFEEVKL